MGDISRNKKQVNKEWGRLVGRQIVGNIRGLGLEAGMILGETQGEGMSMCVIEKRNQRSPEHLGSRIQKSQHHGG